MNQAPDAGQYLDRYECKTTRRDNKLAAATGATGTALVLSLFLTGCASSFYHTGPTTSPGLSFYDAKQTFLELSKPPRLYNLDERTGTFGGSHYATAIKGLTLRDDGIDFAFDTSSKAPRSVSCSFESINDPVVQAVPGSSYPPQVFLGPGGIYQPDRCPMILLFRDRNDAVAIANAIYVLKHRSKDAIEADASFETVVRQYRTQSPKPTLPEDARRYMIQADTAASQKQYDDAAELYDRALRIAPWLPVAHFNRALVLGERGSYGGAVVEMKRYLALVPGAPDARDAQDKIYEWERLAQRPRTQEQTVGGSPSIRAQPATAKDCFIATAAYGSTMDPHVRVLREFRDRYLIISAPGRAFVRFYNRVSPPLAEKIRAHPPIRAVALILLTPVVYAVMYPGGTILLLLLAVAFGVCWTRPWKRRWGRMS
jgi:tetratricopeptide (TPR) repeat protein